MNINTGKSLYMCSQFGSKYTLWFGGLRGVYFEISWKYRRGWVLAAEKYIIKLRFLAVHANIFKKFKFLEKNSNEYRSLHSKKSQVCQNPLINKFVINAGLEYKYSRIFWIFMGISDSLKKWVWSWCNFSD